MKKAPLVKQILEGLGVTIRAENSDKFADYKQKLTMVSIWTDEDLKVLEVSKRAFESLKPEQW